MKDSIQPIEELIIRDVETMKVVSDARRLKILQAMQRPITVKNIATEMRLPPSKLYYHVNMLEEHNLIRVVSVSLEKGIVEKTYQVTARQIKIRNPILVGEALPTETAVALWDSLFDSTKTAFAQAFTLRDKGEPQPPRHPFASKKSFQLSETQLVAFHAKLAALIQETDELAAANQGAAHPIFELMVAFYQPETL